MKKLFVLLLAGCLAVGMMTGCSKEPEVTPDPVISGDVEVDAGEEEQDIAPEGMSRSYLTGEWVDEALATQRPIAVMYGNTTAALPQYGISKADVIYESPVEGGLTRILAVTQDYKNVEKIMSVRSCRHYFVHWALEYQSIYVHFGQAYLAYDILGQDYVNNINGLDGSIESIVFSRDSSRKAPHNAYTTGEKLVAGIAKKGYETTVSDDYAGHFLFNKDDDAQIQLENGTDATYVKTGYPINKPWFEYDAEDGLYYRYQHGKAQVDGTDNTQVAVKNILLQVCDWEVMDQEAGYLNVDTTSGGHGYYITNGKMVPVTWSKADVTSPTKFFYEDGTEITLNQGKTWVCIIQDSYEDKVSFIEE